jgi:hypothetical protein
LKKRWRGWLDLSEQEVEEIEGFNEHERKVGKCSLKGIVKSFYNPLTLRTVLTFALLTGMTETKAQQSSGGEDQLYLSPSAPVATGKAPGMKVRLLA